jgi:glycosyltransferase involved in cell wall biosynthesis
MSSRVLKILYDDSLAANPAGTGTFTRGLLAGLRQTDGIEVVTSRFGSASFGSVDIGGRRAPQRLRNAVEHLRYFGAVLPARARAGNCDVIFSPTSLGPLRGRTPAVVTVHDLTLWRYPETVDWLSRAYLRVMLRTQVRRSAALCTVSRAVRAELLARFPGLTPDRVHVVPDAPDPDLLRATPQLVDGVVRPFFLMVGTIEPRKNHLTAIRAFATYLQRHPQNAAQLVIAGSPGWLYQPVIDQIEALGLPSRVRRLGHVDLGRLSWLYRNARALLFPSIYEGFGIPVVEAFALGCPVIAAKTAAVSEVAGEGTSILLPALDVDRWAQAIERAAVDSPNPGMLARARDRAAGFSWDASAKALHPALLRVSEQPPPYPPPQAGE